MSRVECEVEYLELDGDHGTVSSVRVHCGQCGHATESFGQGGASIRRCLALLREECREEEENFYTADGD